MKAKKEINWNLLAKYLSNEADKEESEKVENWLSSDTKNSDEFEKTKKIWDFTNIIADTDTIDIEKSLWITKSRFSSKPKTERKNWGWLKIAASVLIVLSIGVGTSLFVGQRMGNITEVFTGAQESLTLELPDGSTVNLNANSALKYREKFGRFKRKVYLSGEAFFDVVPDRNASFEIDAGKTMVRVMGTSFNVKAYEDLGETTVSVSTGIVEISKKGKQASENWSVFLEQGSMGVVPASEEKIKKCFIKNQNYLAWQTKNMNFKKTPLAEVAEVLHSAYQANIQFEESGLANLQLTASFNNKDIDYVLNVIVKTFGLNCDSKPEGILLSKK